MDIVHVSVANRLEIYTGNTALEQTLVTQQSRLYYNNHPEEV